MSDRSDLSPAPEPRLDAEPPEGPGGVDSVESWEGVHVEEPVTPDQPRSAQVTEETVPDEIQEPEDAQEEDSDDDAAAHPEKEDPA